MFYETLFFMCFLALALFASEDLKVNKTQNIVSSNKALSISNRILKEIVAPYLTIIDAFYLYRTCQHFFVLFGRNHFGEWLKENQEILKLLYKTSQLEKHKKITVRLQKCNFTLKFPPGIFLDDEDDLRLPHLDDRAFDFRIVGSVDPYGTSYLKPMLENLNLCEKPKIRRSTNDGTPLIMVCMDKEGKFMYRSRQNAIPHTDTGLIFNCRFGHQFNRIEIYDGNGTTCFGYLSKNTFITYFSVRFPENIHVNFPHSNYLKEEENTTNSTIYL